MEEKRSVSFVANRRVSEKKLIVALAVLLIIVVGLIVGLVLVIQGRGNGSGETEKELSVDNCTVGSDDFDAESCVNYIKTEAVRMCYQNGNGRNCFDRVYNYIKKWIENLESEPELNNDLRVYLVEYCFNQGRTDMALEASAEVDEEMMSESQKYYYYGYLSAAYYQMGDIEAGNRYLSLSMDNIPDEIRENGYGGG